MQSRIEPCRAAAHPFDDFGRRFDIAVVNGLDLLDANGPLDLIADMKCHTKRPLSPFPPWTSPLRLERQTPSGTTFGRGCRRILDPFLPRRDIQARRKHIIHRSETTAADPSSHCHLSGSSCRWFAWAGLTVRAGFIGTKGPDLRDLAADPARRLQGISC